MDAGSNASGIRNGELRVHKAACPKVVVAKFATSDFTKEISNSVVRKRTLIRVVGSVTLLHERSAVARSLNEDRRIAKVELNLCGEQRFRIHTARSDCARAVDEVDTANGVTQARQVVIDG